MKNLRGLDRLLVSNRFLIVFALVIAVVGWISVAMSADQWTEHHILEVPVRLDMMEVQAALSTMGLSFIGAEDEFVRVEVFGPRTVVGNLGREDFEVSVIVNHVTEPGYYNLDIWVARSTHGNYDVLGTYPTTMQNVRIDHVDIRMFDVDWEISGLASAPGYMADLPRLAPSSSVWITGPQAELERIDRVIVISELEEALNRPWAQELPITLLDVDGNEIDLQDTQLDLEHESLTLQIPVLRVRSLPLVVDFQNMPSNFPENSLRSQMEMSATRITIAGPISTMANHNDWWLGFINMRSVTPENNLFFFDIDMPSEQFINVDNLQTIAVEFDPESWDSTTFDIPAEDFIITGQPEGYEVIVQTLTLNDITFVGDAEAIEELTLEDITVEINLNDRALITGPQPHPVRITVADRRMVWAVEEAGNLIVHINVTPTNE